MKIATYTRVSSATGQTGEDRYGLPRQQAEVAAYVAQHNHTVVATFEDVGSGATLTGLGFSRCSPLLAPATSRPSSFRRGTVWPETRCSTATYATACPSTA